jgi:hypothetical protein
MNDDNANDFVTTMVKSIESLCAAGRDQQRQLDELNNALIKLTNNQVDIVKRLTALEERRIII